MLLRWLNSQDLELVAGERLLVAVPPHCLRAVAEVASYYAREWERLADVLQQADRRFEPRRAAQWASRPMQPPPATRSN
jgi:hypothetical protein